MFRAGMSDRADLHFAEFHHAAAVLQRKRAFGELGIAHINGLHAVQHDRQLRTLRGDVVGAPLAANLDRHHGDRKSTRLNSSHTDISRMPSSA